MQSSVVPQSQPGPAGQAIHAIRERAADLGELISAPDILLALGILGAAYCLIRAVAFLANALANRLPRHRLALLQLVPLVRISLWIGSIYLVVAGIISPSRESLIAFAAAAGIAIGFAAQDVLKNVFGGILILMDRPFQVGDLVDIGRYRGEVVGIGLRATRVRTSDDSIVTVPNAEVVSQAVLNANGGALDCPVTIELFLPGHIDTTRVREICYEAAAASPYLFIRKPIAVYFQDEFREMFLTRVRILAHVHDHRCEKAFESDVVERARRALLEAGLLPEPVPPGLEIRARARSLAPAAP